MLTNKNRSAEELDLWIHMSDVIEKELDHLQHGMKDYVEMVVLKQILSEFIEQSNQDKTE